MRNLLATILIASAFGAMAAQQTLTVDQVWSRAAMAGHEGVVYLTISNSGAPDSLTAVSTPVAGMAQLHQTVNDNGVMKMRKVESLRINHGASITLVPGGYHIMLTDLKQVLKQGDTFPLTLTFAKAGQITVTAKVEAAGSSEMSQPMSMPTQNGKRP